MIIAPKYWKEIYRDSFPYEKFNGKATTLIRFLKGLKARHGDKVRLSLHNGRVMVARPMTPKEKKAEKKRLDKIDRKYGAA